ncbi:Y-family DNA polymerase [Pseudocnuella soli]|uniref:Y-family DNA polymerase n=1 Tax=Pseudocnuella soli TaxID=2502779 RepID=UPI001F0062BF|nr:DNA polymerase Y family protein [Pseudocnuella soli]
MAVCKKRRDKMGRRFVSIWFPHLATDWFTLLQPRLRQQAFVLKSIVHGRMVVAAANVLAQQKGVHAGMLLADARAIFPGLEVLDDKPNLASQLLQRAAEWCVRFTPVASPDPPAGVLLDATGCAHLWGGEDAYLATITNRLAARGYTARVAMAGTPGTAWALARFGKANMIVQNGAEAAALKPLPAAALRLDAATIDRLTKLGLRQVGVFIAMPHATLRRRFGPQIIQRLQQALGTEQESIQPVYPPEPFQERLPTIEPIRTRGGIEVALHNLLSPLCTRLRKEGKGLRAAYFRCYRTDSQTRGIEITTSRPAHNEAHLFYLFSLKLDTLEPGEGIELFVLEATKTEVETPLQESLYEAGMGVNDPQLAELFDRITTRLGADVISRYLPAEHYWPERSFKQAPLFAAAPDAVWKTDKPRPLQLLSPPEPVEVAAPIPDYPPMLFRHKGRLHKIVKADGPERIEQEWWIQEGEHRDYYCVEDEEGCRYWLFRLGHYMADRSHQWFLHGYFA